MLYLLSLPDTDFANVYVTLLPQHIPGRILSRGQLAEILLREEFNDKISEPLMSPPTSEVANKGKKRTHREKRDTVVSNANETHEAYIRFWPPVVPNGIVYECTNAYCGGSQWTTPPVCCVCSRRQDAVEMHDIVHADLKRRASGLSLNSPE